MRYKKDEDLEFLKNVKSEDLNKLVKILTDSKTEELTKRDIYKAFDFDHNIYWQEIAAELQYFGGNTVSNIIRQEGVLYAEILRDVWSHLEIKYDTSLSIIELEEIFLSEERKTGFKEQFKQNVVSWENMLLQFALPVRVALLLKKVADPAFRITVDAVKEIATLRKKYQLSCKDIKPSYDVQDSKIKELTYSSNIVIRDEMGSELVELKIVDKESSNIINFDENEMNDPNIDNIKQLLADAFKGVVGTPNQTVELVFSPEVQQGLANGTYKLMDNRAIVINSSGGGIKEHAKVLSTGKGRQLLTGGFQLLSIAVAQSHLADIEKNLSMIKSSLEQILQLLDAEDRSKIEGYIKYTTEIVNYIRNNGYQNELSPQKKNKIEDIICELRSIESKIFIELENLNDDINKSNDKDTFGTKDTYDEIKGFLKRVKPLKERYELMLQLSLILSVITKYIDPLDKEFSKISIDLDRLESILVKFNESINKKKLILKSYFNLDDTLDERKKILQILQERNKNDFDNLHMTYKDGFQKIENSFNGASKILLSFDDNANISKYSIDYNF